MIDKDVRNFSEFLNKTFYYFNLSFYTSGRCRSVKPITEVEIEINNEILDNLKNHNGQGDLKVWRKNVNPNENNTFLAWIRVRDYKIISDNIHETEDEAIEHWNSIIYDNIDLQERTFEGKVRLLKSKLIKKGI